MNVIPNVSSHFVCIGANRRQFGAKTLTTLPEAGGILSEQTCCQPRQPKATSLGTCSSSIRQSVIPSWSATSAVDKNHRLSPIWVSRFIRCFDSLLEKNSLDNVLTTTSQGLWMSYTLGYRA
ncbi:unnamed protein product [Protopolystoma xenopodis]|uniref:Uncharacterized protein n=1 Tax=Protopolystoma xenopodis TaxID=117903 RepID=A0A448XFU8_9PLAT|nr:unnamed protein product [Protopolystoma xenopodis]